MLKLYINKSESRCECSWASVHPYDKVCPHCGGTWTHLSSDYADIARLVIPMRPDLEPAFEWEGFWRTEEGERELAELRADVQVDPNQRDA